MITVNHKELPAFVSEPIDRRGFLSIAGFSMVALGTLAGCTRPSPEALVPYLEQTPEMQPGQAHGFGGESANRFVTEKMLEFFKRNL